MFGFSLQPIIKLKDFRPTQILPTALKVFLSNFTTPSAPKKHHSSMYKRDYTCNIYRLIRYQYRLYDDVYKQYASLWDGQNTDDEIDKLNTFSVLLGV